MQLLRSALVPTSCTGVCVCVCVCGVYVASRGHHVCACLARNRAGCRPGVLPCFGGVCRLYFAPAVSRVTRLETPAPIPLPSLQLHFSDPSALSASPVMSSPRWCPDTPKSKMLCDAKDVVDRLKANAQKLTTLPRADPPPPASCLDAPFICDLRDPASVPCVIEARTPRAGFPASLSEEFRVKSMSTASQVPRKRPRAPASAEGPGAERSININDGSFPNKPLHTLWLRAAKQPASAE